MWLSSLLTRRVPRRASVGPKPKPTRLVVEALEHRAVLSFLAPITSPGSGVALAVGDFNHDGRDDVAAMTGTISSYSVVAGRASVSLSDGNGTFEAPINLSGAKGHYLVSFTAQDVNGDSNLDVVATMLSSSPDFKEVVKGCQSPHSGCGSTGEGLPPTAATPYVNVWQGHGDGTFDAVNTTSNPYPIWTYWPPAFAQNTAEAFADFNRDGTYDVAFLNASSDVLGVGLRNPDRTFQPLQTYPAGPEPGVIAAGDFNGDGWIDLIVVNAVSSKKPSFSVLFNNGNWS